MQTPTITFTETMRGQAALTKPEHSPAIVTEDEDTGLIKTILAGGSQDGMSFPLILKDLVVAVVTQQTAGVSGLRGSIEAGSVIATGLSQQALIITEGEFELLPEVARAERRMRYRLHCRTSEGERSFLVYGFKRVANRKGRWWPLAVWLETTTLYVTIYEVGSSTDETGTDTRQPVAAGIARIYPLDFLKQMLTFRSRETQGLPRHVRNMLAFAGFFIMALASVYRHNGHSERVVPT
jgi:hypothetical protein